MVLSYSQYKEDQLIQDILLDSGVDPNNDLIVIDVGAADGLSQSNSRLFLESPQNSGLLFEAADIFESQLLALYGTNNSVSINMGMATPHKVVDSLLQQRDYASRVVVLTIDIDGFEYNFLESLSPYCQIICVEYNASFMYGVQYIPVENEIGSSLSALEQLLDPSFKLARLTPTNAIFVRRTFNDSVPLDNASERQLENLKNPNNFTGISVGYNGRIILSKPVNLHWHSVEIEEKYFQVVPRFIRRFPPRYSASQRFLFRLWKAMISASARRSYVAKLSRLLGR